MNGARKGERGGVEQAPRKGKRKAPEPGPDGFRKHEDGVGRDTDEAAAVSSDENSGFDVQRQGEFETRHETAGRQASTRPFPSSRQGPALARELTPTCEPSFNGQRELARFIRLISVCLESFLFSFITPSYP